MKTNEKFTLLLIILNIRPGLKAQQTYCDFEGLKVIHFGEVTGHLDSLITNPDQAGINSSIHCARYIRDTSLYDNFKIYTNGKMQNVDDYANNTFSTPKIKMKIYSTAPAGTQVLLQIGSSINNNYPGGVHSEYIGVTNVQNAWQTVTFNYYQSPSGGLTNSSSLDKLVLLFHPGSNETDTIYFDDLVGPTLAAVNVPVNEGVTSFKLFQNTPNPAKELTRINFQLSTSGYVSLIIYDFVGNPVITVLDGEAKPGSYSVPVNTESIPNGIYFYTLKKDGVSRSLKMIISK